MRVLICIAGIILAARMLTQAGTGLLSTIPARLQAPQEVAFKIPPVKIPINIKDQRVTIAVSALISLRSKDRGINDLKLELTADLADLQQNITGFLSAELDKNDRCGDRITIQNATLTPLDPAGFLVVQLHYERWACARVLGKEQVKRVIGGNAVMQMKLTPAVNDARTTLRLVPEVESIQADGSLGELLRSGALGDMLREKIRSAILSAMQKGTDLAASLPVAVQGHAAIENAQFKNGGQGRLLVFLTGEIQITNEQLQALSKQVNDHTSPR
jgi:hypothetical protein